MSDYVAIFLALLVYAAFFYFIWRMQ